LLVHSHAGHSHDHGHEAESDASEHVLDLTSTNFDTTIAGADVTLVEFFAPWCGHCKRLAPEYEKAAAQLWGKVPLAKVDCTIEKDLCGKYGVEGFPTIKVFRKDGTSTDYDKGRTQADIVKFLLKQSQAAYAVVTSTEELEKLKSDDILVVGYFESATSSGAKTFLQALQSLRDDATFALVTDSSVEGYHPNTIVLHRKFDEPTVTFKGEITEKSIGDFVRGESVPLVGEIGPENYQKYVDRGLPLLWAFVDYAADETHQLLAHASKLAKAVKDKLLFVKLDGKRWASHAKNFGLTGSTPGIAIEHRQTKKKYVLPEGNSITYEALEEFVNGFVDGSLSPNFKTQEPPTDNDGPVRVIVGKTFNEIVLDKTKDVLVEFYAPWCGHCKTLAPKYDALGEAFKDHPSVIIAKVDATENDTPADIQGFPTIIFYPTNNKEGLIYRGERSKEALESYVKENSGHLKDEL